MAGAARCEGGATPFTADRLVPKQCHASCNALLSGCAGFAVSFAIRCDAIVTCSAKLALLTESLLYLTSALSDTIFAGRDAQDAARGRDGYDFFGNRIRVELSHGSRDMRGGGGPPPPPQTFRGRGTGFRALVKGLPISCSWQDLKVGCALVSGRDVAGVRACSSAALGRT